VAENHLNRQFNPVKPGQAWVSDLTYIRTGEGWLYLTIIMDLYDRKVIGWALSTSMKACETVIPAWQMALKNRPIEGNLLFHRTGDPVGSRSAICLSCVYGLAKKTSAGSAKCDWAADAAVKVTAASAVRWDNAVAESFRFGAPIQKFKVRTDLPTRL
jgi:putative transposase